MLLESITDNVRKLQAVFTAVTQEVGQVVAGEPGSVRDDRAGHQSTTLTALHLKRLCR